MRATRFRPASLAVAVALAASVTTASACGIAASTPTSPSRVTVDSSLPNSAGATVSTPPSSAAEPIVFAVIGDYGTDDRHERAVAKLVTSWNPAFVITTGDNYYRTAGGKGTSRYDESVGAHYGAWLKDISTTGKRNPVGGAETNAFFPSLGNHDYSDATPALRTYLTYFKLPGSGFRSTSGNERYYDFVQGEVHFFVLNSNAQEPDGTGSRSRQARWLKAGLAASTSRWNLVYEHHPPFSSDAKHGSAERMQWPFAAWGADAVISGHAHTYERISRNGIAYFVNGLGGAKRYGFDKPVKGSEVRYNNNWGAQKVTIAENALVFEFYSVGGKLIDRYARSGAEADSN